VAGASAVQADTVYPAANPKGHYAALDKLPDWGGVRLHRRCASHGCRPYDQSGSERHGRA
jgi:hypothetical protein